MNSILLQRNRYGDRRGATLLAGVACLVSVSVLSLAYLSLSLGRNRENEMSIDARAAFYIAEAGLAEAYAALAAGRSGTVGSAQLPASFADGYFWVEATDLGDGRTELVSTGLCGGGRTTLTIVVDQTERSVASLGLFGDDLVRVEKFVTLDVYDSRELEANKLIYGADADGNAGLGEAPTEAGGDPRLRLNGNGDIRLLGDRSTVFDGDATPGPAGSLLLAPGVSVTGSTAPNAQGTPLPPVEIPEQVSRGDFVVSVPHLRVERELHAYGALAVAAGSVLEVVGPTRMIVDSFTVRPGATLVLDSRSGPIKLFVRDGLDLTPGSLIASTSVDPTRVGIFIAAPDRVVTAEDGSTTTVSPARLAASGALHGFIYSPQATIAIPAQLELFGSAVADELIFEQGARVHFDVALLEMSTQAGGLPTLVSWRFVDVPDVPIVRSTLDPEDWLRVQGKNPRESWAALDMEEKKVRLGGDSL